MHCKCLAVGVERIVVVFAAVNGVPRYVRVNPSRSRMLSREHTRPLFALVLEKRQGAQKAAYAVIFAMLKR